MPRPGPRRPNTTLRLSAEGTAWADQRAVEEGLVKADGAPNRSELIRLALAYAQRHMPKGWRPDKRRNEMTTIASLAAEFHAQPYEVAAFADLGTFPQDAELDADTEAAIREAWENAPSQD